MVPQGIGTVVMKKGIKSATAGPSWPATVGFVTRAEHTIALMLVDSTQRASVRREVVLETTKMPRKDVR